MDMVCYMMCKITLQHDHVLYPKWNTTHLNNVHVIQIVHSVFVNMNNSLKAGNHRTQRLICDVLPMCSL